MTPANSERSAAFYDGYAEAYDRDMGQTPLDRWVRAAFREFVAELVPAGGRLLDFGCGTGLDAAWYASAGYRVEAYDNSSGMLDQLRRRCETDITAGRITVTEGAYDRFLARASQGPSLDAVVSNFAVLNLIEDLEPLFEALAARTRTGGWLICSVLNPYFWKDMLDRRWWIDWSRSLGLPAIKTHGTVTDILRHRLATVARSARPNFRVARRAGVGALIRRTRGPRNWHEPSTLSERLEARGSRRWPLNRLGHYHFLALRRA